METRSFASVVVDEPSEAVVNEKKDKNIVWFGSSRSSVLDVNKIEKETNMKLKRVRAIEILPNQHLDSPEDNFTEIVPKVVQEEGPDVVILEAGDHEIDELNVNEAISDRSRSIDEYKKDWISKVKEDSTNVFSIAQKALEKAPNAKVVILKKIPHNDLQKLDPLKVKSILSEFANGVYDHLWIEQGCPKNISIVSLDDLNSTKGRVQKKKVGIFQ